MNTNIIKLKDNLLIKDILTICKNDISFSNKKNSIFSEIKITDCWFMHYRLQVIFLLFSAAYDYFGWDFSDIKITILYTTINLNLIPIMFFLVYFLTTIFSCLVNIMQDWRIYSIPSILHIGLMWSSYHLIKKVGAPYYKVYILSLTLQIIITAIFSLAIYIKSKKLLEKHKHELTAFENETAQFEAFYQKTIQSIKEQTFDSHQNVQWLGVTQYQQPLTSGENYLKPHIGNYVYYKSDNFSYYDHSKKQDVKHSYEKTINTYYHKYYHISYVPTPNNQNVLNRIRRFHFTPIYPFNLDEVSVDNCTIYSIECECYTNTHTTSSSSNSSTSLPSQDEINAAQARINEKYDNRERMHNLLTYERDYTAKEVMDNYGFTNERWQDVEDSEYLRKKSLDNYINKNTNTETKTNKSNYSNNDSHSRIIMYIVNGCLFYNPQQEPDMWPSKDFYNKKADNYYTSREEEVEATIDYLINYDFNFAKNIIDNMWNQNTELASKIMHSVSINSCLMGYLYPDKIENNEFLSTEDGSLCSSTTNVKPNN